MSPLSIPHRGFSSVMPLECQGLLQIRLERICPNRLSGFISKFALGKDPAEGSPNIDYDRVSVYLNTPKVKEVGGEHAVEFVAHVRQGAWKRKDFGEALIDI